MVPRGRQPCLLEEGTYPVVGTCADNEHLAAFPDGLLHALHAFGTYDVGVPAGEMLAEIIEIDLVHIVEEKPEQALLAFAVVVEMKFHQYDERQKEHKTINQREPATGEVNKGDERVVASQCSVEVEGVYFFSMFHSQ